MGTVIEPAKTDRRDVAELVAHKFIKRQNADVWVWSDGVVTKRIGKTRRFSWRPEGGATEFLKNNKTVRGVGPDAFERI